MKRFALAFSNTPPMRRLMWWLLPPLLLVASIFAIHGLVRAYRAHKAEQAERPIKSAQQRRETAEAAARKAEVDRERFTLEVYGVGLVVEKLRHGAMWKALKGSDFHTLVIPDDPKSYPWSNNAKEEQSADREIAATQCAFGTLGEKWECPLLQALPPLRDPFRDPDERLNKIAYPYGMIWNPFKAQQFRYDEIPDDLFGDAFAFFEKNLDLPLCLAGSDEGIVTRNSLLNGGGGLTPEQERNIPPGTEFSKNLDGYPTPGYLRDAMTAFALGRRDRVDALRPYAFSIDPNDYPHPDLEYYKDDSDNGHLHDRPVRLTVPLPPLPGSEAEQATVRSFKPTPWLRRPWAKWQIAQFDARPVMARLQRPQRVEYLDAKGHPLGEKARNQAFLEAWTKALSVLPEGQKPVRIFYDAGGPKHGKKLIPLSLAIQASNLELDLFGKSAFDLSIRLGDTGASSHFVGVALGVYATQDEGGVSAVVSLCADDHATIQMVLPPTIEDKARNEKCRPWLHNEWIAPHGSHKLVEPKDQDVSTQSRLPIGTQCPSGNPCPESGRWQCAHLENVGGQERHYEKGQWLHEALIEKRGLFKAEDQTFATTWTLVGYENAPDQGDRA